LEKEYRGERPCKKGQYSTIEKEDERKVINKKDANQNEGEEKNFIKLLEIKRKKENGPKKKRGEGRIKKEGKGKKKNNCVVQRKRVRTEASNAYINARQEWYGHHCR